MKNQWSSIWNRFTCFRTQGRSTPRTNWALEQFGFELSETWTTERGGVGAKARDGSLQ